MKIALVHDYIKEYGGAERVLEALHEIYPDAPIYTSVFYPQFLGPHQERFEGIDIRSSWMQYLPFGYKLISPLRMLSPFIFASMNLSAYDVIIVSQTGAYFPNMVKKGPAKLITYTHTPPRYLYGYKTARDWKKNKLFLILGEMANHILRMVDYYASQNVDQFIANSEEVKARIKKFYRKDAVVIYPPIDVTRHLKRSERSGDSTAKPQNDQERYYLAGGRLARAKGMEIIVDAFIKNRKPLKIFGKGFAGYEEDLKSKMINYSSNEERSSRSARTVNNIEFLGEVTDEEKLELMHNAKAYIFASYDEDFGITPVEAMGVGTPVIAYKSGGVQETVIDGKTGVLYTQNTPDILNEAVRRFEKLKLNPKACYQQALMFSAEQFKQHFKQLLK